MATRYGSMAYKGIILVTLLALVAAFLAIRPVGAQTQTEGCQTVGTTADDRKAVCYYEFVEHGIGQVAKLSALEKDFTQVVKVWELVVDENDPAGSAADLTAFPDYGHFSIDRDSAVLTFKSPPDYENPRSSVNTGSLADMNVYKVMAKVGDGEKFLRVQITVQVRGKEEPGTVTFSNRQPEVGETLTATLADGDIRGLRTPDWQWEVETDTGSGVFEEIDLAVNAAYTPRAGDVGKKLRATAQYQDSHGTDYIGVSLESKFAVRAAPAANVAPMFRDEDEDPTEDGMQTSRRIEENTPPGMKVGPPVFATDNDHLAWNHASDPGGPRDVLTYSLGDGVADTTGDGDTLDDGLFSIDQITGQIMTKSPLNKESGLADRDDDPANGIQLEVTANATDPSGEIGRAIVTIHVLDEVEAPQVMGPAALTYFENQDSDGTSHLLLFRDPTQSDAEPPSPAHPSPADVTADNQATYMATDNDLDDDGTLNAADRDIEWQITGDDASKFQFVGSESAYTNSADVDGAVVDTGPPPTVTTPAMAASPVLRFKSAPDLENAADKGGTPGDNVYEITVVAWDEDWEIGRRDVTIRVADSNDEGTITLSHVQAQVGTPITATLKDQDDIPTLITWTWTVDGNTVAADTVKSSGDTSTYTPATGEAGVLAVTARYTDGGGNAETATYPLSGVTPVEVRANDVDPDDTTTPLVDESGLNTPPKFYSDDVADVTLIANRKAEDEVTSYTRYVLENQTIQLTKTELEARTDTDTATVGHQVVSTGRLNVFDGFLEERADREADPRADEHVTNDTANLQFDLSGADANKYFSIQNAATPAGQRGLISTKMALDFETKSTYTVMVTATDPAGRMDTVTVTIEVLDVPEIEGVEQRIRVDENTKEIAALYNSYTQKTNLGGLKWSLLTTDATPGLELQTSPDSHNRNNPGSIDCHYDATNEGLCDNFRFSRFNTSDTTLLFAIGTGEDHDAPNFEDPKDRGTGDEEGDNIYKIVVRVAFANLRSHGGVNHPNPEDDEKNDRVIWIRVDDVDEAPSFADDASTRLIAENSDDTLPSISINRSVLGTVTATDPEDTGSADGKKLTYTLDAGTYDNLFQIVPSSGEILTRSRLNYEALDELEEMGPDGGQHRIIEGLRVTATDSAMPMGNSDGIDANIRVNDVNETPIPVANLSISGDATRVSDYAENQEDTTVGTYTVSGDNEDTAVWGNLEGPDAGHFKLERTDAGRTLKFKTAPDYENPMGGENDNSNTYEVTLKVTTPSDSEDIGTLDVTVEVTDVPELGTISGTASPDDYMENGTGPVATYTTTGPDTATWSVEGDDRRAFSISSGGMLEFSSPPNFEDPADANTDNEYMVTVKATGGGETDTIDVTITVTDVPELGTISGPASPDDYMENGTGPVATYTTTGPDTATWSVEGDDGGAFNITGGTLEFSSPPNFEAPADANTDNVYMVTVKATGGGEMATIDLTITVTGVNEAPMVSGDATPDYEENGTGPVATYTATDPENDMITWSLSGADMGDFTIEGGVLMFNSPPDYEAKATYTVMVTATDPDEESGSLTVTVMVTNVNENMPMFPAETATRSIVENQPAGRLIGAAIAATDADDADTLTYTLSGTGAASFAIDSTTGQLRTKAALDYETKMTYMVTVNANDGNGGTDSIDVTINVTDVNDAPAFPSTELGARDIAENTAAGMDIGAPVAAADADTGDTLTYTLGGTDGADFAIDDETGQLMTAVALDYETKPTYMVTVTATDPDRASDSIDVTITVTDEPEPETVKDLYDNNKNDKIDREEVLDAIDDFFAPDASITREQVLDLIDLFFEGLLAS